LVDTFGSSPRYWIGFTDEVEEGLWLWVTGEPMTYTNWSTGEPSNSWSCGEDYVIMNWRSQGRWNDLGDCSPEWSSTTWAIIEQSSTEPEDITPLELGTAIDDEIDTLTWKKYALEVAAGLSVQVEVTPAGSEHQLWFFESTNQQVSLIAYDQEIRAPTSRDTYVLTLSPTLNTTYYFSLFNRQVTENATSYTIRAQSTDHALIDVTPRSAGNAGTTTVQVSGLGFVEGMQVSLVRSVSELIVASSVDHVSTQSVVAIFDLTGVTPGSYDLQVANPNADPLTLENAFNIVAGSGPRLEARLEAPAAVRPGRPGIVWLSYSNVGDADLIAPVFTVGNIGSPLPMKLRPDDPYQSGPVQVLGIHQEGAMAGILPPGAGGRIPIYFRSDTSAGRITFNLSMLNANSQPIDWSSIATGLQPDDVGPELWDLIWNRFVAQVGATGADYQRALTERASYLSQYGEYVSDVRSLLGMMLNEAAGSSAQVTLAASLGCRRAGDGATTRLWGGLPPAMPCSASRRGRLALAGATTWPTRSSVATRARSRSLAQRAQPGASSRIMLAPGRARPAILAHLANLAEAIGSLR
jgi:hypothetical protein